MDLRVRQFHSMFVGEATGVDLSADLPEPTIAGIAAAIDRYAVLIFPEQRLDDDSQLAFARRFGPIEPPQTYSGARRLKQKSNGILATIIGGKVAFRNGDHTGALDGKLLRSTAAGVR